MVKKSIFLYLKKTLKYFCIINVFFMIPLSSFAITSSDRSEKITPFTIHVEHLSVKAVLEYIEKNSQYIFVYSEDIHNMLQDVISISVKDKDINSVLKELSEKTGLVYNILGRQIIVSKLIDKAQQEYKGNIRVSGNVTDENGIPLIGVMIILKGDSTIHASTDMNGAYTITVPNKKSILSFRYIGFVPKEETVKERKILNVTMVEDVGQLDEVVVVGYGSQKKVSVVGSVQTVRPSELIRTSSNLTTAFAGKIAGVIATQTSGEPGADGANFWIRGISTFGANTAPLIVLDGVEITQEMINNIPPETIESFSVLKDATATALYGSRGANGVLIINTKNGRDSEKMSINVRFENGFSTPTKIQKMADGVTYMRAYNEASSGYYDEDTKILPTLNGENPYVFPNVDWYDTMFKDWTVNQNFNLNMTGGTSKVDYFLNASIANENGIMKKPEISSFKTNVQNQSYSFQANLSAKATKTTRISLKTNTQLKFTHVPQVSTSDLFYYTMRANPVRFPATYPSESGENYIRFGNAVPFNGGDIDLNPYAEMSKGFKDCYLAFFTTAFTIDQDLEFITKGLTARGMISFYNKTYSASSRSFVPFYYTMTNYSQDESGAYDYSLAPIGSAGSTYLSSNFSRDGYREMTIQASVDYKRVFADVHRINAMLVYHQKERLYTTPSDASINTDAKKEYRILPYRDMGLAGRFTYGYKDKYLFEFNFGYNGSDNFAEGHRFGFFPSVAVGYVISSEPWFEKLQQTISLLKLRASYGLSGNDIISNDTRFPYLGMVDMNKALYHYIGVNFNRVSGPIFSQIGNEEATWEKSKKLNIGLELGLYNELTLIVDAFYEKRSGIFMQYSSIPSYIGFLGLTPYANIGKVDNKGLDASLEYNKSFNRDFDLSVRGTFTYAHNEVKAIDEGHLMFPYQSLIGKPINSIKGLVANGLFESEEDIAGSAKQDYGDVRPGDIKYQNMNGDDKVDDNDMTVVGKPTIPEIMYGFGASMRYKNWDFSFFFQGAASVDIAMSDMHPFADNALVGLNIAQYIVDDHWSEVNPNPHAKYPRLSATWNTNNTQNSSYWMRNGSYLRLKNVELGYTFKRLRAYVTGQNLLTFSPFKYWDPELGSGNGLRYPLMRTIKLGVQYNF